jgi:hypothetical protein
MSINLVDFLAQANDKNIYCCLLFHLFYVAVQTIFVKIMKIRFVLNPSCHPY